MGMTDIIQPILESSSIALIIHVNPDGDAIGSSIGLMHALDAIGKSVDIYCQDNPPKVFSFLDGFTRIKSPQGLVKSYDLAIALDCSDRERMGNCSPIMDDARYSANIDHHISNTYYADINIVDGEASATGELIFDLVRLLVNSENKNIAEALYTAIASDTGGFSFSNTSPKTHRIIADLLEWGIRVDELSNLLFKNYSFEWVALLGEAINTLQFYHQGKVAVMHITQKMLDKVGATSEDSNGIIQYAKDIKGVELAILLREIDSSTIKVGFRSQSTLDVSTLAQEFGGGGHKRASGCTIKLPLCQAQDSLMKVVDQYFEG